MGYGISVEVDILRLEGKIRDRLDSHKINQRAKDGFVFILDNCIEKIDGKTQEKKVIPSKLRNLLDDDEVKSLLHNIVKDEITYLYLHTENSKDHIQYCASFNQTIIDFLGIKYALDKNGSEKEIEFPCLIYFKYENNQCSDFLYRKLVDTENEYLIFYELASSLEEFVNILHDSQILETPGIKSPILKLISEYKWKDIREKIQESLLTKTIEYAALTAAPAAFVALSTVFK
jgi:hypothetical protein